MRRILEQIKAPSEIDVEKDYATVTIEVAKGESLVYQFNMSRGCIMLTHKSHAPIAAISGKRMQYKSGEISATNNAFKWLGIKCKVDYEFQKREGMAELKDGVISFFND